ncbi:peptidoglycan-binding protein [Lachnospiraceae bacterium OttesenSCG-928-D06]|nr:peptidoglycan-binding protein [Lachnospiraceae bacterium OttesenSCG-928-D06]
MEEIKFGQKGPMIEYIQSIFQKEIDTSTKVNGIFDSELLEKVKIFQERNKLLPDGIIGSNTFPTLLPYLYGYSKHVIQAQDSSQTLTKQYKVSWERILWANPGLQEEHLDSGDCILIPKGHVVPNNIHYSYDIMQMNLHTFSILYPFLKISHIGYSEHGRKLSCVRIGKGRKEIFYSASFHANEWITTPVLMKFIERFSIAYAENGNIYGQKAKSLFEQVSIYLIPMVNPDGVDLVTGAIPPHSAIYQNASEIALKYPDIPFPEGWKANIKGIDLNLQFPAHWEKAKENKYALGFTSPAPRDYVGPRSLYAVEAKLIYQFTLAHDFKLILAYHTQGEVIYWKYLDYLPKHSEKIALAFETASGYALEETPYASSFAGYKDWFIQRYNRPGYTIEAGMGESPLPVGDFPKIYSDNEGILALGAALTNTYL